MSACLGDACTTHGKLYGSGVDGAMVTFIVRSAGQCHCLGNCAYGLPALAICNCYARTGR
jgi:hypothetical protein